MGIYFPVTIVAAMVAWFYGRSVHRAWFSAGITFVCVLLGGILFSGIGQIGGIVVSALVIFVAFTLPEQRRSAREEAERENDVERLPNEEDV